MSEIITTFQSSLSSIILKPETSQPTQSAVILLHGRGSNERDLFELHPYFDPRMIVASVHAPFQFAWGGYTWFDMDQRFNPDESQFNASTNKLLTFIDDLQKAFSIPHDKLFLLGFSMGSIMSFSLALFRPELFRGVICLSGCILEHINAPYRWTALSGTSFFIGHGITDPIVPISLARRAHTLLTNASADTTYREYDGGHSISEECLSDVLEWLDEKLSSPPKKDTQ